jgi:uncharacterized protein YbjT (DUF2867 family)
MKIVVMGGTGLIGSKVVANLKQKGHEVLAAAPNTGINTITGKGLKEAMAGTQGVIDLANSPSFEDTAVVPSLSPIPRAALEDGQELRAIAEVISTTANGVSNVKPFHGT